MTVAGIACSSAPATASAAASEEAATHGYLEARIALQRTWDRTVPAGLRAIGAVATHVRAECPGVLANAPTPVKGQRPSEPEAEVSQELVLAAFNAFERVERPADIRFATAVRRLHWSNSRLTRMLHSLAIEQAEQSAIAPPDLCSDMKFWVASDYTAVSAGTKRYLHRLEVVSSIGVIESEPGEPASEFLHLNALIAHQLKPYEDRADRLLARKALPPEPELTSQALRPVLEAVGSVEAALGRSSAAAA
jgi:hypothetical protein